MSGRFPCKNIDSTKFGAVVWQHMRAVEAGDGETERIYDLPKTSRFIMVAAFLNFDDAVNYAITEQEKGDAECQAVSYINKSKIVVECTSGNSLARGD